MDYDILLVHALLLFIQLMHSFFISIVFFLVQSQYAYGLSVCSLTSCLQYA